MKQLIKSAIFSVLVLSICRGQSQFDLSRDVKGQLPVARIIPGVAGQCLTTNGSGATAWGTCAAGSGTVTTFSAGTLSPLFTTSVSNPSTTPTLSFTLSNFAAHTVFGNNTGFSAAPVAFLPKTTDLADFNASAPSSSGKVPIWDQPSGTYIPGDPLVQGVFADGSTSAANPVAIGGYDTAGTPALHKSTWINGNPAGTEYGMVVRNIPSGTQTVTVSNFPATQAATQSGAWTVTANQGGSWTVTANAGSGNFNVAGTVTSNAGTGTFNNQQSNVTADYDTGAGVQTLTMFGIALPASGGAVAGGTATNPIRTDPTGTTTQPVSVSNFPATQAVTQSGSWTVTANAGTNLNTSALALDTSVNGLQVAQASTTSGQKGSLAQGAVTTSPPTYTTAQTDPLSLDTSGNLRTTVNNTVAVNNTQQGTASQNVAQFGGTNVSTGTGAGGSGIPRVTVSNDSAVNQTIGTAGFGKLTDGNNTQAVKAASTAAAATDPSSVTQLSPNQPQLTTPLNVQGAKTNNNAAPGATNFGTLPAVANAASPSFTEGNQGALSMDLKGNIRVNGRPPDVVGCYQVNGRTSTYAGLSAGAPLFSFRWGDATHLAIINHVKVQVIATVAATTAGQAERELIVARSFTASDTGGTAVTLTGNNQKLRTSFGTTLVTDMRFGTTITAGTRTLDANPLSSAVAWLPLNMTGVDIGCSGAAATAAAWSCVSSSGYIDLLNTTNNQDYPLILAQNEGFIVRVGKDAMPAGATQQTYLTVAWCEVNSY
jgi:hypothetical protein